MAGRCLFSLPVDKLDFTTYLPSRTRYFLYICSELLEICCVEASVQKRDFLSIGQNNAGRLLEESRLCYDTSLRLTILLLLVSYHKA